MKRDMYYQNLNQGYASPGAFTPPSGYQINTNYQAYGPNIMPNTMPANIPNNYNYSYDYDINERINSIERQIKSLDTRLQKLESNNHANDNNVYMI